MLAPLTINRPIPFGVHRDGSPAAAGLRDGCAAVVGEPGSGKTVLLQNLTVGLLRCPDVLVWMVDLSEGGLSNPYVGPWRRGLTPDPVIDWLASDVDEALLMTAALTHAINFRRRHYEEWMWDQGVDKLPLSHDLPGIEMIMDEGKMVTGISANQKLTRGAIDVSDRGRGMGGRLIMSGLRGTAEVIPSELMAGIGARIGMSVANAAESNYLFGWNQKPNPRDTPYPGCGLWRASLAAGAPIPFRSHDLGDPRLIAKLAQECLRWRPQLDGPTLMEGLPDDLREAYLTRWERAARGTRAHPPSGPIERPGQRPLSARPAARSGAESAPGQRQVSAPGQRSPSAPLSAESALSERLAAGLDTSAVDTAFARAKRALTAQAAVAPGRLDETWAALAETLDADRMAGGEGWADGRQDDRRTRARQLLTAAGPDGLSGPKLHAALEAEGHRVSLRTVYRWLAEDAADNGYGSYVRRDQEGPS